LHRQLLHTVNDINHEKVKSIERNINERNPNVRVITHGVLVNSKNAMDILEPYDIVVDATDNVATRYLLNDACVLLKKPLVSGSALQLEGQMTVYNYHNGPCYRCIFPKPPPPETVQNCGDSGVIAPVTGVIGSLQAMEVLKIIMMHENVLAGKLLLYDAAAAAFRTIKLRARNENCEVCGNNPTIKELIDYEQFCGMCAEDKNPNLQVLKAEERMSVNEYACNKEEHILIDVRSPNEFEICHLENAINVPIKTILSGKIDDKLREQMQQKAVIVVCRRGNDSQLAARYLAENLSIHPKDIVGGLHEWSSQIDNDFPIY
jgi:adenylyltransferase/sulfurtransferase